MRSADTATALASFEGRGAGTDVERRAAQWLAGQLEAAGRAVRIESFWCRPNWALAHSWHVVLALVGSLVAVSSPRVGGALVLVALISVIADERLGVSPGRRLTLEHASQNVVSEAPVRAPVADQQGQEPRVHLIITANYDAGRSGFVYREAVRRPFARATAVFGRLGPVWVGWLGWLTVAMALLLATAILRLGGDKRTTVGVLQFVGTVGLVLSLALLLEIASSTPTPAASDNGSGVAVALALAAALDAAPPRRMAVEVVLQGAGDAFGIGLRRHLRARRHVLKATNTVVLGIAASGAGRPRWWIGDGQLIPLRYFKALAELCARVASEDPTLKLAPHHGRGAAPAFRARTARLPAISIGCLDEAGLPPRSHRADDTPDALEGEALDAAVQFGLMLVDAVDAFLRDQPSGGRHRIAFGRPLPVLAGSEREPPDELGP